MNSVLLILGSNLGDKIENLCSALRLIELKVGIIHKKSKIYTTSPVEYYSQLDYVNIGVSLITEKSPINLLKEIKKIEKELGRMKDSGNEKIYSDRIIDIDIVYFNDITFISRDLIIPHEKHINHRDFSKVILNELK